MSLKDQLVYDLSVLFATDEFAEDFDVEVGGATYRIPAVVDADLTKTRSNLRAERFDGIYSAEITIFVRAADIPERPVFGQPLRLDGKLYQVAECSESAGVLEIRLGVNDA